MVGTGWLYHFGKSVYALKNSRLTYCDLVIPLGYGLLNRNALPDAAKKTLKEAIRIAAKRQVPIAWASANYFWPGGEEKENQLKMAEARVAGLVPIIAKGVTNTVTEAQNIRQAVLEAGFKLEYSVIVVVVDWPHARSARKIWREIFPESAIIVVSIDGQWNESHPAFFLRSELRWLFINVVRHFGLIFLGTKRVSRYHHPIKQ